MSQDDLSSLPVTISELTRVLEKLLRMEKELNGFSNKWFERLLEHPNPLELLQSIREDIASRIYDNQMFDLPGNLEVELAFYRDRERQKY